LSTWDCTSFPFNWLGKVGGGLVIPKEEVGESLREAESLIGSLFLGSFESLDGFQIIGERYTSSP